MTRLSLLRRQLRRRLRRAHRDQEGYVSVLMGLMALLLFGMAAFAVDVGTWYVTGQAEQRAADAAALAGVPRLPGDKTGAFANAQKLAAANGFINGADTVSVVPLVDGDPTRLKVTVTKTVENRFGGLFGVPTTTISRSAVADYAGPVPMGSPCNAFGNDPDKSSSVTGAACASVNGQFWTSLNSYSADKANGDPYQSYSCPTVSTSNCSGGVNSDYTADGYFYTITVKKKISNLTVQVFDPAWVDVGLTCTGSNLNNASSIPATKAYVSDPSTRYASGSSSKYCTGDNQYAGSGTMTTNFQVRNPNIDSPWSPTSFPVRPECTKSYPGFSGSLSNALDNTKGKNTVVAATFRRWVTLCTITNAEPGDYLVQVQTPTSTVNAGNRFAIRAYSSIASDNQDISISGRERMSLYSNAPSATTEFYLARVPSGSEGQLLNISLFDVGDSTQSGTIRIVAPPKSGVTFKNCVGTGPSSGTRSDCSFTVSSSTHQGKWQTISIPIPTGYKCVDTDYTDCWVRLRYEYGSGSAPTDVTAWTANLEGDPVRLVE